MIYSFAKKHIETHPILLRMARIILFVGRLGPWRNLMMTGIKKFFPNTVLKTTETTIFPHAEATKVAAQLNNLGYSTGLILPEKYTESILEYYHHNQSTMIENPHLDCHWVNNIAHDPIVVEIAKKYLEIEPILFKTNIYCSPPTTKSLNNREFHYDAGDFKGLTIFIYLTDVDLDGSPHILIENTQNKNFMDLINPYLSYEQAEKKYKERIKIITGKKGTILFEDLTTYHQRSFGRKERIVLTITYLFHRKPD